MLFLPYSGGLYINIVLFMPLYSKIFTISNCIVCNLNLAVNASNKYKNYDDFQLIYSLSHISKSGHGLY